MRTLLIFLPTLFAFAATLGGCGKSSSFSLLEDVESFKQTNSIINTKVDILWVIDNSGSMETSQQNVINNLDSFIQDFSTKGLDFKMAVTTTDAYKVIYRDEHECSRFRDGIRDRLCQKVQGQNYSGVTVMDRMTLNLADVFLTNILLTEFTDDNNDENDIFGSGDERAFQSMREALNESLNAGFLRDDSFLSVIIVSDEEDFSHNDSWLDEDYANPGLHTIQSYVDYLDAATQSTSAYRRYNVNAMAIFDEACRAQLSTNTFDRKIGHRYGELVDLVNTSFESAATRGLKTSLCGNFADDLKKIAGNILTLANRFSLNRVPIPSSIQVIVNGVTIPQRDANPLANGGWIYEQSANSILFIGSDYIPPSGSTIRVIYDPVSYGG